MIKLRLPGDGPVWLRTFADSIVAAFKQVMSAPFRLWGIATADLPPASDWGQGVVYDVTTGGLKYSNGSSWVSVPLLGSANAWAGFQTFSAGVRVVGGEGAATLVLDRTASPTLNRFRMFVGDGTAFVTDENYISNLNTDLHILCGAAGATEVAKFSSAGLDVTGLSRCDSFRIDQTPTSETITPTHTITISVNGTDYKIPMVAA